MCILFVQSQVLYIHLRGRKRDRERFCQPLNLKYMPWSGQNGSFFLSHVNSHSTVVRVISVLEEAVHVFRFKGNFQYIVDILLCVRTSEHNFSCEMQADYSRCRTYCFFDSMKKLFRVFHLLPEALGTASRMDTIQQEWLMVQAESKGEMNLCGLLYCEPAGMKLRSQS